MVRTGPIPNAEACRHCPAKRLDDLGSGETKDAQSSTTGKGKTQQRQSRSSSSFRAYTCPPNRCIIRASRRAVFPTFLFRTLLSPDVLFVFSRFFSCSRFRAALAWAFRWSDSSGIRERRLFPEAGIIWRFAEAWMCRTGKHQPLRSNLVFSLSPLERSGTFFP